MAESKATKTKKVTQPQKVKDALKKVKNLPPGVQAKLEARFQDDEEEEIINDLEKQIQEDPEIKQALVAYFAKQHQKADPNAPKRNVSSFMQFLNSNGNRQKMVDELIVGLVKELVAQTGKTSDEVQKEAEKAAQKAVPKYAGERWETMTEAEKQPYLDEAQKDKERYERELAAYNEANGIKKARKKPAGAPKGVRSGYLSYMTKRRAEISQALIAQGTEEKEANKEAFKSATAEWNALSEAEKAPYLEEQAKDQLRYKTEMAAFKANNANADEEVSEKKITVTKKRERETEKKVPVTPVATSSAPKVVQIAKKTPSATTPASSTVKTSASSAQKTSTPSSTKSNSAKPPAKKGKVDESE